MKISRNNERNFMKTLIATLATAGLLAGGTQRATAGDRECAAAGIILTGVAAGAVIASAIVPAQYTYPSATWYAPPPPPPVYVQPAPVVVYSAPVCARPAPVVVFAPPRPVVSFSVGFGGGHHHWPHHRIYR